MATHSKIQKPAGEKPDNLELTVAKILQDIENGNGEVAKEVKNLHFCAAKEVEVSPTRKAVIIFVPVPLLRSFQKIHNRLVREMEKKFSDKHVVIVGNRKIISKAVHSKQQRPRSRTLSAVHESLLNDMVFPTEIVAKRTRVNVDGSRLFKIFLDNKDQSTIEHKIDTFSAVYKKLTGKTSSFLFSVQSEN